MLVTYLWVIWPMDLYPNVLVGARWFTRVGFCGAIKNYSALIHPL